MGDLVFIIVKVVLQFHMYECFPAARTRRMSMLTVTGVKVGSDVRSSIYIENRTMCFHADMKRQSIPEKVFQKQIQQIL